jgi:hypothetical protein
MIRSVSSTAGKGLIVPVVNGMATPVAADECRSRGVAEAEAANSWCRLQVKRDDERWDGHEREGRSAGASASPPHVSVAVVSKG